MILLQKSSYGGWRPSLGWRPDVSLSVCHAFQNDQSYKITLS